MEEASQFSLPEGMRVEHLQITEHGLVIAVEASHPTSCCPLCAQTSQSIKTHYRRVVRDAPCIGRQVQLVLTVRKFYCRNPSCSRKVFTERLPTFVEPWARMTIRCCQHITSIGLATCGKGGARLAARLGIQTTRPTTLRRIMGLPDVSGRSVVYVGIDDFADRAWVSLRYHSGQTGKSPRGGSLTRPPGGNRRPVDVPPARPGGDQP